MPELRNWKELVNPLFETYIHNRQENERLSSIRDALLPQLMSGELDVSGIDF